MKLTVRQSALRVCFGNTSKLYSQISIDLAWFLAYYVEPFRSPGILNHVTRAKTCVPSKIISADDKSLESLALYD